VKLASLKEGRDGRLIVVSRDLTQAVAVPDIAATLQAALDEWHELEAELASVYRLLNDGHERAAIALDLAALAAPLPRAYQWCDASAYLNHVELVRKSRGVAMPPSFQTDPLIYQGGSDDFLPPVGDIAFADDDWGIDFEAEVAVVLDDVPMGIGAAAAARHVKLVMLVNDVSLRGLAKDELAKGMGFFHTKPSSAFSPVAVTPGELGAAWRGGKLHLPLLSSINGRPVGRPNAGVDMQFDFPTLIAHAAKTRNLRAGTILGSGTVSNRDPAAGSSCIIEIRSKETIALGKPETPYLRFGDRVRIEMLDGEGRTIFGALDHTVRRYNPPQ
jgi:fumarylacetoacetate (FAA) hydrolase